MTGRVFVPKRSVQHPADDAHTAVRVAVEACTGGHAVLVDGDERSEADVVRVVVRAGGEAVVRPDAGLVRLEPPGRTTDLDHGRTE